MATAARTLTSLSAATSGTGTTLEVSTEPHYLTCYVHSTGTISAGVITFEEAHDSAYASTWAAISAITVPTSGNQVAVAHAVGCYPPVRARVTTSITGGGSASAVIVACPVRS